MMTIRHVGDDGRERVVSVVSVRFDPEANSVIGLDVQGEPDRSALCEGGYAYVMNDFGKTVAVYNLRSHKKQEKKS